MPHEGYADPVTNDRPEFHSNVPVSELTKRVTRAIKATDVSSTPLVAETVDGVTHETRPTPRPRPTLGLARHLGRRSALPDPSAVPDTCVGAPPHPTPQPRPTLG